jgi:Tfp pilus assembly protein PilF
MSIAQLSPPPSTLAQILDQAFADFNAEKWSEARTGLAQAIAQHSEDAQLQAALGIVHFKLEDYGAARAAFATAVRLNPDSPELLTQQAMSCLELGDTDAAEVALRRALFIRPDEAPALRLLAACRETKGDKEESERLNARLSGAVSRTKIQADIAAFYAKARTFFANETPPRLAEAQLANSRLLPHRSEILRHMPRGGTCAEIGTQTGRFAKRIIELMQPAKFHIYDIDFTPFDYPAFAPAIAAGTIELHEGDSATLLGQAPDRHFDFIYIDGDHAYEGVKRDLEQAARKVKADGWVVCNDYASYSPLEQMKYGVYRAVNEFCLEHNFEIVFLALHKWGYHDVALRKRTPSA